jgi:hypothetical protein
MAGISSGVYGFAHPNEPMTMYWGFQLPDEASRAAQVGDELVIRAKSFYPPGSNGSSVTHITYELRHGSETRMFSGPANRKFTIVCGLIVGAPLVLWSVTAGVVALCGLIRKVPNVTPSI